MAQQQLMLLVLAALVTAFTIVVGMNRFQEEADAAEKDQILLMVANLATRAQAWYHTPALLGGGGKSFADFSFDKIHYRPASPLGTVDLSYRVPGSVRIVGRLHNDSNWSIVVDVYPDSFDVTH